MLPNDLIKTREICFCALPPDQVIRALKLLNLLENVEVRASSKKCCVLISYSIEHYTMEILENVLIEELFHLENTLMQKLRRAIVYYSEEVQRENMALPERVAKEREIFVKAYELHPHGDYDETPVEWREYR